MRPSPLLLAVAALAALPATAPAAGPGTTTLVSTGPGMTTPLESGLNHSYMQPDDAISADGRYVVFSSDADGLVTDDDDRVSSVFLRDRETRQTILVSRSTGASGEPNHEDCEDASVSDDGRRVAFVCRGGLDPVDTNGRDDVYVRDVAAGTTTLASRASGDGPPADERADDPAISGDGRYVAFASYADNLSTLDPADSSDIFRRELDGARETRLMSVRVNGSGNAGHAYEPAISFTGDRVAFASSAQGHALQADVDDTNGTYDVYVRIASLGTTRLVSLVNGSTTEEMPDGGTSPSISGDGLSVAFASAGRDGNTADTDAALDIFRRGIGGSSTVLVSGGSGATNKNSYNPSVDYSGRRVAFMSQAGDLGDGAPDDRTTVRVHDLVTGDTVLASRADGDTGAVQQHEVYGPALSGDGTTVVFGGRDVLPSEGTSFARVYARTLASPARTTVASAANGSDVLRGADADSTTGSSGRSISDDGRFVAFTSEAAGLSPLADGFLTQAYVRDMQTGAVTLVSRADGPGGRPSRTDVNEEVAISGDGRRVAFITRDPLHGGARGNESHVYVRDIVAGTTQLASRADDGSPGTGFPEWPSLDADGSRVAFTWNGSDLGPDPDGEGVVVRDLETGRTLAGSRTPAGTAADASGPSLSGDGTRVAYESTGEDMGIQVGHDRPAVFLTDLTSGSTRVVGPADSARASLDRTGRHVAYLRERAFTAPRRTIEVRDVETGATSTATVAPDGGPLYDVDTVASLSADGTKVAFAASTDPKSEELNEPADPSQVYLRDVAAGTTTLVSRVGADGPPVKGGAAQASTSADGGCVVFTARGLTPLGRDAGDYESVWVRTLHGECGGQPATAPVQADAPPAGPPALPAPTQQAPKSGAKRQTIAGAKLTARRFRVGTKPTAKVAVAGAKSRRRAKVPVGTEIRLRLGAAGRVTGAIVQQAAGHRKGKRCLAGAGKGRKRCTRTLAIGRLARTAKAGAVTIPFSGRLGRQALKPGRYTITLTATAPGMTTARPVTLPFTVVR